MSLGEGRHDLSSNDTNASVNTYVRTFITHIRTFLSFFLPARSLAVKSLSTKGFPDFGGHGGIPPVLGVLDAINGGGGGGGGIT